MSEETLIMHCSPTLAGLKTGNLFNVGCESEEEISKSIRKLNKLLVPKGLCVLPIKIMENRALIYVYRPKKLEKDFRNEQVCLILKEMGYPYDKPKQCVSCLTKRLRENSDFPHEIGLFLGYPAEDVRGFIENKAENFRYIGFWKVYGDVENAQKKFEQFKKCTNIYHQKWTQGFSIEKLTVSM